MVVTGKEGKRPMAGTDEVIITIEPARRGGRPTLHGTRIAVSDVLGWLADGMTPDDIVADFPELTVADVRAALAFAARRERGTLVSVG